jgi:HEAT repeat protein
MPYRNNPPCNMSRLSVTAAILCGLLAVPAMGGDPRKAEEIEDAHQQETAQLLKLIKSEPLTAAKGAAFECLAVVATADAIPALAELLADEQLAHYARCALEPIPDRAVDQVLRAALGRLEGKLLVGAINSIGVRRDAEGVAALTKLLAAADTEVASAAANALGCIASDEAAEALKQALAGGSAAHRAGVAQGAVVCAENMAKQGLSDQAIELVDQVRRADVPANVRLAGLRAAILARGKEGLALMADNLGAEDSDVVDTALRAAREMGGEAVAQALVARLEALSARTRARVILALGDLGERSALPAVVAAAKDGSMEVRAAAIASLKNLGDVGAVPLLWQVAVGPDPQLAQAAAATLGSLPGESVDAAIVKKLDSEDAASNGLALDLIGQRRIESAVPALIEVANTATGSLRLAAVRALGETVSLDGLSSLVDRVISAQGDAEKKVTREALTAACVRMPKRDAAAAILAGRVPTAPDEVKRVLLVGLSSIGGDQALAALLEGARGSDPVVQDKATEVLGKWIGSDIGPALLGLVKTMDSQKYRIRVLRGYIRLAKQFGLPPEETMTICGNALDLAERANEKREVFSVLARNPSPEALALAVGQLDDRSLREEAASCAVSIAEHVARTDSESVVKPMEQLLQADIAVGLKHRARAIVEKVKQTQ